MSWREKLTGSVVTDVTDPGDEEWQAARRGFVGASEVGAMLTLDPFKGPWTVWAHKRGIYRPKVNLAMRMGQEFEGPIMRLWAEEYCAQDLEQHPPMLAHDKVPHVAANIDGIAELLGSTIVVEAKFLSWREREILKEMLDGGPARGRLIPYWLQVQQQMAVSGLDIGHIVALVDKEIFSIPVKRDADAVALILSQIPTFWGKHVDPDLPPAPVIADFEALNRTYKVSKPGEEVEDEEMAETVERLRAKKAELKEKKKELIEPLEKEKKELEGLVKARLGEAEILKLGDGIKPVTWKANKNGTRVMRT